MWEVICEACWTQKNYTYPPLIHCLTACCAPAQAELRERQPAGNDEVLTLLSHFKTEKCARYQSSSTYISLDYWIYQMSIMASWTVVCFQLHQNYSCTFNRHVCEQLLLIFSHFCLFFCNFQNIFNIGLYQITFENNRKIRKVSEEIFGNTFGFNMLAISNIC